MKLHFREYGQGAPLIILHGLLGSCDNWVTLGKQLGEQFHVYLVDQRNHGQSPHDATFNYTAMAEDLDAFIKDHDLQKTLLVGHSMGGKTAMKFSIQHPEKVEKLVVVDIAPKYYPVHHQKILEGLYSVNLRALKSRNEADEQLVQHVSDQGIRQFLLKNLYRTDDGFAWRFNLGAINDKIENVGEAIEGAADLPALFIRGSRSDYIGEEDTGNITTHFPQASITTIEGAGHWIHAEQPEAFTKTLLDFLDA